MKWHWFDSKNKTEYCGGGLIIYNDQGFWLIGELKNGKIEYSDFGGKYNPMDVNIYGCIARETSEETFHTISMSVKDILNTTRIEHSIYVKEGLAYFYILMHEKHLKFIPDPEEFNKARLLATQENPKVKYKQVELRFVHFEEFSKINMSTRLKLIIHDFNEKC